jgi:hypothetical protein
MEEIQGEEVPFPQDEVEKFILEVNFPLVIS